MYSPPNIQGNLKKKHLVKPFDFKQESSFFFPKFGMVGVQCLESGKLNARQIEAARRIIRRSLRKKGSIKINIFPNLPLTKKPVSSRMGKGKGKIASWIAPVKKGRVIYELSSKVNSTIKKKKALYAFSRILKKLPIKARPIIMLY